MRAVKLGQGFLERKGGSGRFRLRGVVTGPGGHEACTWAVGAVAVAGVGVLRLAPPPCLPFPALALLMVPASVRTSFPVSPFPVHQRFQSPGRHSALPLPLEPAAQVGTQQQGHHVMGVEEGLQGAGQGPLRGLEASGGAALVPDESAQKGQWSKGTGIPERQYKARETGTALSCPEEIKSAFLLRVSQETAELGRRQVGGDAPAESLGCSHTETADVLGEAQKGFLCLLYPHF